MISSKNDRYFNVIIEVCWIIYKNLKKDIIIKNNNSNKREDWRLSNV